MKNWRTTVSGLIGSLGILVPIFGLPMELGNALTTVGIFFLGVFSKDSAVVGKGL
ncbi:MAG: hypothetical protein HY805_00235 [Nitrospirae bacterium]|nr:hypothetical protein [Nitrospirota bacterium]